MKPFFLKLRNMLKQFCVNHFVQNLCLQITVKFNKTRFQILYHPWKYNYFIFFQPTQQSQSLLLFNQLEHQRTQQWTSQMQMSQLMLCFVNQHSLKQLLFKQNLVKSVSFFFSKCMLSKKITKYNDCEAFSEVRKNVETTLYWSFCSNLCLTNNLKVVSSMKI